MPFTIPSFDELLNNILTDYQNQQGTVSTESLIRAACLASAIWGAYKHQEYILKQNFPDTADTENLEHHFWVRTGEARRTGETDAQLLARLLAYLQQPPAGGNQYDYIKWATSITNVKNAWCFPLAQGLGTVDVVFTSDSALIGSEIPSSSARQGQTTSVTAGKLVDSAAVFNADHPVVAGDIVENPLNGTTTTVISVDSATQLTLTDDIFKFVGETYLVHAQCGTNTSVSAGKLVDSAGAFDNATYTVQKGDIVKNLTDGTQTTVVSQDSATQLTLTTDIFTATGKHYQIIGLVAQVKQYIDSVRPVTASKVRVIAPSISTQNITMGVSGQVSRSQIAADITSYMNGLVPAQTSYLAQRIAIAISDGATNAAESSPNADIVPTGYQMIRPGTITVT